MTSPNLASSQNVMPIDPPVIASLNAGDNTVYTVPATKMAARLDLLVLTNTSNNDVVVSVSVVPRGSVAGMANRVGPNAFTLPRGDSLTVDEIRGWIGSGVAISVNASIASSVVAKLTGLEFA